jgi:hypothetical protein
MLKITRLIGRLIPWGTTRVPTQEPEGPVPLAATLPDKKAHRQRKPDGCHEPKGLDQLFEAYASARDECGDMAQTIKGLVACGRGWSFYQARDHFGLRWGEFKSMADAFYPPKRRLSPFSLDRARALFSRIEAREGHNAHGAEWLSSNGFACLVDLVTHQLGTDWEEFLSSCGITVPPCPQKDESPTVPVAQTGGEFDTGRLRLGKRTMTRADDVHRVHARQLAKHGLDTALNTGLLRAKGSGDIHDSVSRVLGLNWSPYLLTFGAYLAENRPGLLPDAKRRDGRCPPSGLPSPSQAVPLPMRVPLGKRTVSRLEDIAEVHAHVLAEHGFEAALGTGWLNENGYSDIRSSAYVVFGFTWSKYVVSFGAYLSEHRPDLLPEIPSCTDDQRDVSQSRTIKRSA